MISHLVTVDLGKRLDYAAIGILKAVYRYVSRAEYLERNRKVPPLDAMARDEELGKQSVRLAAQLTWLERFPIQTKYSAVVRQTALMVDRCEDEPGETALLVDSGNAGEAVIEMMEAAGLSPVALLITAGRSIQEPTDTDNRWHVPRTEICTTAQEWYVAHRITYPPPAILPIIAELEKEFRGLKRQPTERKVDDMIVSDEAHDDLAMCVGQGLWYLGRVLRPLRTIGGGSTQVRRGKFDPMRGRRK